MEKKNEEVVEVLEKPKRVVYVHEECSQETEELMDRALKKLEEYRASRNKIGNT